MILSRYAIAVQFVAALLLRSNCCGPIVAVQLLRSNLLRSNCCVCGSIVLRPKGTQANSQFFVLRPKGTQANSQFFVLRPKGT